MKEILQKKHIRGGLNHSEEKFDCLLGDFLDIWSYESTILIYCNVWQCNSSRGGCRQTEKQMPDKKRIRIEGRLEKMGNVKRISFLLARIILAGFPSMRRFIKLSIPTNFTEQLWFIRFCRNMARMHLRICCLAMPLPPDNGALALGFCGLFHVSKRNYDWYRP